MESQSFRNKLLSSFLKVSLMVCSSQIQGVHALSLPSSLASFFKSSPQTFLLGGYEINSNGMGLTRLSYKGFHLDCFALSPKLYWVEGEVKRFSVSSKPFRLGFHITSDLGKEIWLSLPKFLGLHSALRLSPYGWSLDINAQEVKKDLTALFPYAQTSMAQLQAYSEQPATNADDSEHEGETVEDNGTQITATSSSQPESTTHLDFQSHGLLHSFILNEEVFNKRLVSGSEKFFSESLKFAEASEKLAEQEQAEKLRNLKLYSEQIVAEELSTRLFEVACQILENIRELLNIGPMSEPALFEDDEAIKSSSVYALKLLNENALEGLDSLVKKNGKGGLEKNALKRLMNFFDESITMLIKNNDPLIAPQFLRCGFANCIFVYPSEKNLRLRKAFDALITIAIMSPRVEEIASNLKHFGSFFEDKAMNELETNFNYLNRFVLNVFAGMSKNNFQKTLEILNLRFETNKANIIQDFSERNKLDQNGRISKKIICQLVSTPGKSYKEDLNPGFQYAIEEVPFQGFKPYAGIEANQKLERKITGLAKQMKANLQLDKAKSDFEEGKSLFGIQKALSNPASKVQAKIQALDKRPNEKKS